MDSAVTAALAAREHRLAFLHANYGQRTEAKELACFHALADHFGGRGAAGRRLLRLSRPIGGSSLTDRAIPVREGEPVDGVVPTSYVPFRNAHLLAAATSWAEVLGARVALRRRGVGGLVGLSRLPARVLPRVRGGDPARARGRRRDLRIVTPGDRDVARPRSSGRGVDARASRSRRPGPATRPRSGLRRSASPAACGSRASARRGPPTRFPTATAARETLVRFPVRAALEDTTMKRVLLAAGLLLGLALPRGPRPRPRRAPPAARSLDDAGPAHRRTRRSTIDFQGGITRKFETKTNKKGEFMQVGHAARPLPAHRQQGRLPAGGRRRLRIGLGDPTERPRLQAA